MSHETTPTYTHSPARIRILDGDEPGSMRIGLNRTAADYLDVVGLKSYLAQQETPVTHHDIADEAAAPFVSEVLHLDRPLSTEQLLELGRAGVEEGVFSRRVAGQQLAGIVFADGRDSYFPANPVDDAAFAERRFNVSLPAEQCEYFRPNSLTPLRGSGAEPIFAAGEFQPAERIELSA